MHVPDYCRPKGWNNIFNSEQSISIYWFDFNWIQLIHIRCSNRGHLEQLGSASAKALLSDRAGTEGPAAQWHWSAMLPDRRPSLHRCCSSLNRESSLPLQWFWSLGNCWKKSRIPPISILPRHLEFESATNSNCDGSEQLHRQAYRTQNILLFSETEREQNRTAYSRA